MNKLNNWKLRFWRKYTTPHLAMQQSAIQESKHHLEKNVNPCLSVYLFIEVATSMQDYVCTDVRCFTASNAHTSASRLSRPECFKAPAFHTSMHAQQWHHQATQVLSLLFSTSLAVCLIFSSKTFKKRVRKPLGGPLSISSLTEEVRPIERSCLRDCTRDKAMYVEIHFMTVLIRRGVRKW